MKSSTSSSDSRPPKKAVSVSSISAGSGSSRSHFSTPASSTSLARGSSHSSHRVKRSSSRISSSRYTGNLACSDEQPAMTALHSIHPSVKSPHITMMIASQSGHATTMLPAGWCTAPPRSTLPPPPPTVGESPGCTSASSSSSASTSSSTAVGVRVRRRCELPALPALPGLPMPR